MLREFPTAIVESTVLNLLRSLALFYSSHSLHTSSLLSVANSAKKNVRVAWTKLRYITSSMNRRNFLKLAAAGAAVLPTSCLARTRVRHGQAVTVLGPIAPERLGRTLIHEHVMVDFIGADATRPGRYVAIRSWTARPLILDVMQGYFAGCHKRVVCRW